MLLRLQGAYDPPEVCESAGLMHWVWGEASVSALSNELPGPADTADLQTTLQRRHDVFAKQTIQVYAQTWPLLVDGFRGNFVLSGTFNHYSK